MSRRSANGRNPFNIHRKRFNIHRKPDSAGSPYPGTAARNCRQSRSAASPYASAAARSLRQSVTTALSDSRAATLPERGGLFCSEKRCYRKRTVGAESVGQFERTFCVFPRNLAPAFTHYLTERP